MDQTAVTLCKENSLPADRAEHPQTGRDRRGGSRRARRHPRPMSTIQQILKDCRASMDKGLDAAKREFSSVRSGKASPNMLDTVRVEMYGQQMTLNQVASIAAPEPRIILVTPFDKGQVKAIEKAIRESDLGLEPSAQGGAIRVPLPQMNEQRRKELVKVVHKLAEDGKIAVRHARTHARDAPEEAERRERGRREARREGPPEGPRRLHREDRPDDQGQRGRDHGSLTRRLERRTSPMSELANRVVVSVVAAPLALWIVLAGGAPLAALLAIVSARRRVGVLSHRARRPARIRSADVGIALAGLVPLAIHAQLPRASSPCARRSSRCSCSCCSARRSGCAASTGSPLGSAATTLFGVVYTARDARLRLRHPLSRHRGRLRRGGREASRARRARDARPPGGVLLIFPLVITWASDIGAYFVGTHDRRAQAHPVGEPGKDGRRRGRRTGGEHARRRWLYARSVLVPAAQPRLHAVGRAAVRRDRQRRGAGGRPRSSRCSSATAG